MESKTVSSAVTEETEEEFAERQPLELRLISQGAMPFPTGLDPAAQRRLVIQVRKLRRQRLVDLLALLVARNLAAQRPDDRETPNHVESSL